MPKPARKKFRLLDAWDRLSHFLRRSDPRRFFAGRFFTENSKIIQTAKQPPKRRQRVTRRRRTLVARKRRVSQVAAASAKLGLLAAGLGILGTNAVGYLYSAPRFSITHIGVSGNTHVTAQSIIEKSGIAEGKNIFRLNLAASASAIREIPRVRSVRVERRLPDEVHIEIEERNPVALALTGELLFVDAEGRLISEFDPSEAADVPIITGKKLVGLKVGEMVKAEGIEEALEIVRLMKTMDSTDDIRISEINIDDPANVVMVAEGSGANIYLGSDDFEGKLWRLAKVAREINRNERLQIANLERVDMRFGGTIPAKFKDS